MLSLSIKTNNINAINYIFLNISSMNISNVHFCKKTFNKYTNIIIHFLGNNKEVFYKALSSVLLNYVVNIYEPVLVKRVLLSNYFYFDEYELNEIYNHCLICLSLDNLNDENNNLKKKRIEYLADDIYNYLLNNRNIFLDGFLNFRISNYLNILDNLIDDCISNYIVEKEYSDFINLLRNYISSKESTIDIVHLIYINNKSILLDNNKNIISINSSNINAHFLSDITFSANDYALNSLLSLLPNKIIIHLISKEDEFINTLKLIFYDSIEICNDCDICRTYKSITNTIINKSK